MLAEANLTELGAAGILILLVLKEVFVFVQKMQNKRNGGSPTEVMLKLVSKMAKQSDDQHDWHKPDSTGRQQWRGPGFTEMLEEIRGMRGDIRDLTTAIANGSFQKPE